ncbi:uncharacterized protein METZ01_LOCUS335207, partial [marine metagenome]
MRGYTKGSYAPQTHIPETGYIDIPLLSSNSD